MLSILLAALTSHVFSVGAVPFQSRRQDSSGSSAYCTSSDLTYKLSSITGPVKAYNAPGDGQTGWDLSIDDSSAGHKQTITGFGAAITDATVTSMNTLNSDLLGELLTTLMTSSGADFSLMRHTIAASDLSSDPVYTYDDNGGNVDTSLSGFNLGDRGNAMAKFIANLRGLRSDLEVLGSPWSAPAWMKLNDNLNSADNNNLADQYLSSDQPDYSEPFAQYFVKYLQAYEGLGAHIDAITIQNEPLNSVDGLPTMYVADYEEGHLIQDHIAPALKSASLSTSIWAYDHNTDKPDYPEHVLDIASESVDTVAWHCYANPIDWTVLSDFHNNHPGIQQYMTECYTPPVDVSADSSNWAQAADFTIGPLQNWAQGVIAWTLSTDSSAGPHLSTGGCTNCFGLVTVNDANDYEFTMAYYLIAQFSKFMPKGSTVLSGTGSYEDVQSVASLNSDGTRSVVILNKKQEELYLRLNTTGGESWSGAIPSNSIVTWLLPAGGS